MIAIMVVVTLGFLASHTVMVALSVTSQTAQTEERRQTPDLGAALKPDDGGRP